MIMSISVHTVHERRWCLEKQVCRPAATLGQPLARALFVRNKGLTGLQTCKRTATVNAKRWSTLQCCSTAQQGPDISLLSPILQRQWDHGKNAHLGSITIKPYSHRKVWWICDQCPHKHPHEWLTTVNHRSNGTNCPFCVDRAVCQHNSLAINAPAVAAQWSHKNQLSPKDFLVSSNIKVWWQCHCGFAWEAAISRRTYAKSGCPACAKGRNRKAYERRPVLTDSQHEMMQFWDWAANTEAGLDPGEITCGSDKRAHWICHSCPRGQPHRWQAQVGSMFHSKGSGCPCCKGRQACICNSLQSLRPDIAAEWDYSRNKGTPSDYSAQSHYKAWWHNQERGAFQAIIQGCTRARKRPPAQD